MFEGRWGRHRWVAGFGGAREDENFLNRVWGERSVLAIRPKQVHGKAVRTVARDGGESIGECDALVTGEADTALTIRTADCLPALAIARGVRMAVGAVHAGWRGTRQDIVRFWIGALREAAGCRAEDIWVLIGPAIRPCCYEVGEEFSGYFAPEFLIPSAGGKYRLDLAAANRDGLIRSGVPSHQIHELSFCTHCSDGRFHSYRRNREEAGRNISWIYFKEE